MKRVSLLTVFTLLLFQGMTQDFQLKLWPDGAPNQNTPPGVERFYVDNGTARYDNISEAELFVYLPEKSINTGAAVVICPGGGYRIEAIDHEGFQIAKRLNEHGIAGIVLKYRLPYGNPEIPLADALQAIRFVRSKSAEWGIDIHKVGIAGSSAGGHLASTAGTHFDLGNPQSENELEKISSRPDFMLLLYPVISFDEQIGHMGSRKNLIGETNDWSRAAYYSNELHVTDLTPPAFFILSDDDHVVVPENSIRFYLSMKKSGIPAELHIFAHGGHGFGMKQINKPVQQWPDLFLQWMKAMKFTE